MQVPLHQPTPAREASSPGEGRRPGAGRCLPAPARLAGGGSTRPYLLSQPRPDRGPAGKHKGPISTRSRSRTAGFRQHRVPGSAAAPPLLRPPPGTYFPEPLTPITTTSTMAARRALPLPLCPAAPPPRPAFASAAGGGCGPPWAAPAPRLPRGHRPARPSGTVRSPSPGTQDIRVVSPALFPPSGSLCWKLPDLLPSPLCLRLFSLVGRFFSSGS